MDKEVDLPVNVQERYLYAMVMRLDALCNMMSSLMEHIAEKEGLATETVTEEVKKPKRARKPKE